MWILFNKISRYDLVFIPYKEVLEVYNAGLEVPEDVNIIATNKGYLFFHEGGQAKSRRSFCVCHRDEDILDEFYAIVDCGGRVLNVVVEHEIYGQIAVDLIINNREDALSYVEKSRDKNTKPLNILTNGVHYHTVEADGEEILDKIEERLKKLGYLIDNE